MVSLRGVEGVTGVQYVLAGTHLGECLADTTTTVVDASTGTGTSLFEWSVVDRSEPRADHARRDHLGRSLAVTKVICAAAGSFTVSELFVTNTKSRPECRSRVQARRPLTVLMTASHRYD
jgi:hypothetical protein